MVPFLLLALVAQAPATVAPAAPTAPRLKVLVLDVQSTDMTESERITLMNLETAALSEEPLLEVLNGEDLKQLVILQGQAQEFDVKGNCADACMAELAGALGAGLVISTQVGKLGDSFVVTVVLFDAAKSKTIGRRSVNATSLGELPQKLGPALIALVQPLLLVASTPAAAVAPKIPVPAPTTTTTPTPTPVAPRSTMSPRLQELYAVEAMQICFDKEDRAAWWFCTRKQAFTENAFVREYRALTGAHDVDHGEVNRTGPGDILAPIGYFTLAAVGAGLMGFALACGPLEVCGADVRDVLLATDTLGVPMVMLGLTVGGATIFPAGLAVGLAGLGNIDSEGTPRTHTLSEGEGRGALFRYNDALRIKLARELGN